jgi:hypothetical protein
MKTVFRIPGIRLCLGPMPDCSDELIKEIIQLREEVKELNKAISKMTTRDAEGILSAR